MGCTTAQCSCCLKSFGTAVGVHNTAYLYRVFYLHMVGAFSDLRFGFGLLLNMIPISPHGSIEKKASIAANTEYKQSSLASHWLATPRVPENELFEHLLLNTNSLR